MKLYAVRIVSTGDEDQHEAVGIFWVQDRSALLVEIEKAGVGAGVCECKEITEPASLFWYVDTPLEWRMGVRERLVAANDDPLDGEDYCHRVEKVFSRVSLGGALIDLLAGEEDVSGWTRVIEESNA